MSLPDNMPAIREAGYKYVNSKVCSCGTKIEWWKRWDNDKQKAIFIPVEFHEESGKFLNHFITCPARKTFRKTDPKMLSKAQLKKKEREEKEAEREAAKGPRLFE
jgi:hypothetical protein